MILLHSSFRVSSLPAVDTDVCLTPGRVDFESRKGTDLEPIFKERVTNE